MGRRDYDSDLVREEIYTIEMKSDDVAPVFKLSRRPQIFHYSLSPDSAPK